eukprot:COSAG04_NODE_216_length_19953_cov_85.343558_10_plen_67_part_00
MNSLLHLLGAVEDLLRHLAVGRSARLRQPVRVEHLRDKHAARVQAIRDHTTAVQIIVVSWTADEVG